MELQIKTSGIGNYLPHITIELSRYDLAQLVMNGELTQSQTVIGKEGEFYQETKIIVK
jgi:hypothetical protein